MLKKIKQIPKFQFESRSCWNLIIYFLFNAWRLQKFQKSIIGNSLSNFTDKQVDQLWKKQ